MGLGLVAIVKEDVGTEVADFRRNVWPDGDVFIDEEKNFYKALFGGKESVETLAMFLWKMLAGCGEVGKRMRQNSKNAAAQKATSNMIGEGFVRGGLYVVGKGGLAEWAFAEEEVMDIAEVDDVVAAAERVVAGRAAPPISPAAS